MGRFYRCVFNPQCLLEAQIADFYLLEKKLQKKYLMSQDIATIVKHYLVTHYYVHLLLNENEVM